MAYSFFGNCLLRPVDEEQSNLLTTTFWQDFPFPGGLDTEQGLKSMIRFLQEKQQTSEPADLLKQTRVDYAQLFMGPPRPLAAPWETVYVLDWYPAFVAAVTEKTAHSFYGYLVQTIAGCLQWSAKNIIMDV